ncbi:Dihydropteroate synthase [hydrothermal vent metagenome]|uniref:dihydropteroate synthase n=1 Tax=hydrothermal vent metagenome TaxID=652676 RepID=A0A3B0V907_9ZZZZ
MGVVNVTPNSFSDGGKFYQTNNAIKQALQLIQQGANIIDIGGESTRPGADLVSSDEQIRRVVPVIGKLRQQNSDIIISIDTSRASVMQAGINAGANFINDVNALQSEGTTEVVTTANIPVCLMHKQGESKTMQNKPEYNNILTEVMEFFQKRIDNALAAGIKCKNIVLDPGIGFGKTLEHNLTLLRNIKQLKSLGFPILIGASRKTMIGEILNADINNRLYGSLAVAQFAYSQGAQILRVHDVKATADVLRVAAKLI